MDESSWVSFIFICCLGSWESEEASWVRNWPKGRGVCWGDTVGECWESRSNDLVEGKKGKTFSEWTPEGEGRGTSLGELKEAWRFE
jgi:hypothetical protein